MNFLLFPNMIGSTGGQSSFVSLKTAWQRTCLSMICMDTLRCVDHSITVYALFAPSKFTVKTAFLVLMKTPKHQQQKLSAARSFKHAPPSVWNNLPESIRKVESIEDIRRRLKTSPQVPDTEVPGFLSCMSDYERCYLKTPTYQHVYNAKC